MGHFYFLCTSLNFNDIGLNFFFFFNSPFLFLQETSLSLMQIVSVILKHTKQSIRPTHTTF